MNMNFDKSTAILLSVVLLSGCTQNFSIKNNLDAIKPDIDTVSIIFPHVEYYEVGLEAKKTNLGYSTYVSRTVADILKEIVDSGNFMPKNATIIYDSTIIEHWMPRYYSNSLEKYRQICDSLKSSQDEKRTFPVSSELQLLIDKVSTKYFIFVGGTAFEASEDKKRYDFLQSQTFKLFYDRPFIYDYQWQGLQLHIFIVGKKSMKIFWYKYNEDEDTRYDPANEEDIYDLCLKLLKRND
jgi:hypothetical protein